MMQRQPLVPRWTVYTVVAVSMFRLLIASQIPLNEDEAYYWTWSLHLAFGYTDHPPMVGWLDALTSFLGHNPLAVRLPFIVCEAVAALAVGGAATILSGNAQTGGTAAMILTFIPQPRWAIGEALPDAPYVCFWALSLLFVRRIEASPRRGDMALLGLAMGGALLSRFFSWALVLGIAAYALAPRRRALWKSGLWLSFLIAIAAYTPFVVWNAQHRWENYAFTLFTRQPFSAFSPERLAVLSTLRFLAFAIPNVLVTTYLVWRRRDWLLAWTGLPLVIVMIGFSFFKTVESYWLLGPLTSQVVQLGIAYQEWRSRWKTAVRILAMLAAGFAIASVTAMALPERGQAALLEASHGAAKGLFYSGAYAYRPLAEQLMVLGGHRHAVIITDRLEIAGELVFNGVEALAVGSGPQIPQWRRWFDPSAAAPPVALFVTFQPPGQNPDAVRRVRAAYRRVAPGPVLRFDFAGSQARVFYTAYCESPRPSASLELFPRGR